ncbi:hypothetical protein HPB49_019880 [Dermacentor silvarum]|uniref:Uncharacterized protein n=1 Tax=Dermacentor silvarum TaxID=543639 RepID=A0ACB8DFE6_DERSI|nr:hypothetical protein HPB49_019880 [Dermacentor silvarum]
MVIPAAAQAEKLATEIQIHLQDGRRGERLRGGVKVAIIGRTNVGKSSLFNALFMVYLYLVVYDDGLPDGLMSKKKVHRLKIEVNVQICQLLSHYNISCFTSCTTQQGISDLVKILGAHLEDLCGRPADSSPVLTQERHRRHLDQCLKHLKLFGAEVRHDSVIGAEHLRIALSHLGRITGRVFTEEILDVIFRDFCIGK